MCDGGGRGGGGSSMKIQKRFLLFTCSPSATPNKTVVTAHQTCYGLSMGSLLRDT